MKIYCLKTGDTWPLNLLWMSIIYFPNHVQFLYHAQIFSESISWLTSSLQDFFLFFLSTQYLMFLVDKLS